MKKGEGERRRGFTFVEVIFVLAVTALLMISLYTLFNAFAGHFTTQTRKLYIEELGYAMKKSADLIIKTYQSHCIAGATANLGWGWRNPSCSHTVIFPNLNGNILTYTYDSGVLTVDEQNKLKSEIRSLYSFCEVDDSAEGQIVITCPEFVSIHYCTAEATNCNDITQLKNSIHSPGRSYNYIKDRIISLVVEYDEISRRGTVSVQHRIGAVNNYEKPAFVDFSDFYQEKAQENLEKFVDIYNVLKKYEVTRRVDEMANTVPTSGLSERDDYFVPWVYQVTADSQADAYLKCDNNNCTNHQTNTIWDRSVSTTDLYTFTRHVIDYLLGGDTTYMVDAFNNPIGIELLIDRSKCSKLYSPEDTTNPTNCIRIPNPPYPQENYRLTTDGSGSIDCSSHPCIYPPYIGYVYSEFCYDLTKPEYDVCRKAVVYAN